jgi:hypothetical protein
MLGRKFLLISLVVLTVIGTTPTWAFIKLGGDQLELDGEVLGEAVSETEMEGMRGTYLGFNFSVLFDGFWDTLGNYNANLIANTNAGSGSTTATTNPSLPPNTAVKIEASVGGFGSSRGIFQITQVPGSNNIVTSTMVININIIQVLGNTVQQALSRR